MRIVIAGGTGVIGRNTAPLLDAAGHEVIAVSRTAASVPGAQTIVADVLDLAGLTAALSGIGPDLVVHMATAIPDPLNPKHLARDMALTNRLRSEGTANLIAAVPGARIIAQSLGYGYDPAEAGPHNESAPLWRDPPRQFRPVLDAVANLEAQVSDAGGLALRLGHLYGPGTSYAANGGFTRQVRTGRVPLVGAGGSIFSFVHVRDVAMAIAAAVERPVSGVLNIVDDDPTPVETWLPAMAAMLAAPAPKSVPKWVARLAVGGWGVAFMTTLTGATNAAARERLDWKPSYSSWRDGFAEELSR